VDILSETIAAIRTGNPTSGLFVRHAPWGRAYPVVPGAGFHVVLQGSCHAVPSGGEPIALGVGDVLFMPRGRAFRRSAARRPRGRMVTADSWPSSKLPLASL